MTRILHIDSSPRGERSVSRRLSGQFVSAWKATHPDTEVIYRNLGHEPVPHVDESWIAAAFTPPADYTPALKEAISISDKLVDEFIAADLYVLGVPMYNFNIPSTLKAYIDQIVRLGRTFTMNEQGFQGLVSGKKMIILTSRGGDFSPGAPAAPYDMQEPFLRLVFGFIGVSDIQFIHANSLNLGEENRNQSLSAAESAIQQTAATW